MEPDELDEGAEDSRDKVDDGGIDETVQWSDSSSGQSTIEIPPDALTAKETEVSRGHAGGQDGTRGVTADIQETADAQTLADVLGGDDRSAERGEIDHAEKTIPEIQATIEMGPMERGGAFSLAGEADSKRDADEGQEDDDGHATSVMRSPDISQTINPREMSKEDAAFWGSAAIGASNANKAEQSKLRPAVERSIAESKLQLRQRDLAIPTRDPESPSDYRLIRLLGRGGMGNVYVARQASLDRMIAVKVIKPLAKDKRQSLRESGRLDEVEYERRQQFLSEAVVTGDLDHPNIVPIHDIAVAADNTLFYAMKRVVGQSWLKTIDQKSRDENLEILLKVCDAIAFAHTRGVIHRDIKPENIMLGDFGEVLVMDWGLAIAKPEFEKKQSISVTAGLGGTPAFMAPEMALGPVEAIGPHSDIYLLGATLFYIITGYAPHKADNVSLCIRAVASNEIQAAPAGKQGELMDIALRAMATNPKERFENVQSFQQAIRKYRSHSESVAIFTVAEKHHQEAVQTSRYESFSRASHGFEQAIALWSENQAAIDGLAQCRMQHAEAAYANGDYDLGLSLLDSSNSAHLVLIEQLQDGIRQREQRAVRLKLFRRIAAASLMFILVGGSVAIYIINQKRSEANEQRAAAETQRQAAEKQTIIANEQRNLAETNKKLAEDRLLEVEREKSEVQRQKGIAEDNEKAATIAKAEAEANAMAAREQEMLAIESAAEAERQKLKAIESEKAALVALERAEYESYLSQIGLAKARIDGNEFDDARLILNAVRSARPGSTMAWEWRYLWQQANQSRSTVRFDSGVVDLAVGGSSRFAVVVGSDGSVHRTELSVPGLRDAAAMTWSRRDDAVCVAIDDEARKLVIGTRQGGVLIVDPSTGQTVRKLEGHESTVSDCEFLPDGRFLTASSDHTVALWDPIRTESISRCWHIGPVVSLASRTLGASDTTIVLASVGGAKSGRVSAWRLGSDQFEKIGVYSDHDDPVISLALSEDGLIAASGDSRGHVNLWRPDALRPTDYEDALKRAMTRVDEESAASAKLASARTSPNVTIARWRAHPDAVAVLRFDDSDRTLVTGADDYTIRAWDVADQTMRYSLRGHGGWVRALQLVKGPRMAGDVFLWSASVDGTVRAWSRPATALASSAATKVENEDQLHADQILAARLDRSGRRVITASRDHTAKILAIDYSTMAVREISRIQTVDRSGLELKEGTEFLAMSARVDRAGQRLFVGSADSTIRIWDVETGVQLGSLTGTGLNTSFALSKDGRRLLSGSSTADAKALLWDVDPRYGRPKVLHRLAGHDQAVTAFSVSGDGSVLVTGDREGRCILWNGTSGEQEGAPIDLFRGYRINDLAMTASDESLWVASDSGLLTEIELASRQTKRQFEHEGFVTEFSLSPGGDQVLTLSAQTSEKAFVTTASLWDIASGTRRRLDQVEAMLDEGGQSTGSNERINSVRFSDGGSDVVICSQGKGGRSGRITFVDRVTLQSRAFDLPKQIGVPEEGLLLGNGKLITLNGEAAFRWSIEAMVHEKSYRPHGTVVDAGFSPDGKIAATVSRSVRFWVAETGEAADKLENPHRGAVTGIDFSNRIGQDGYQFATSGNESKARLWSWKDRQSGFHLIREFEIDGTEILHVRFSPDGAEVLLAGANGSLEIHSLDGGSVPFRWELPLGSVATCASFSPDGRYLAIGASDKFAWLIERQGRGIIKPRVMRGHADRIESISVLQDASNQLRVLTASRDKSVRVWDPRLSVNTDDLSGDSEIISGREVLALRRHLQGVTAIDATADGNLVMTAARDGRVLLWPAEFKPRSDADVP